jgi:hypothetical protein
VLQQWVAGDVNSMVCCLQQTAAAAASGMQLQEVSTVPWQHTCPGYCMGVQICGHWGVGTASMLHCLKLTAGPGCLRQHKAALWLCHCIPKGGYYMLNCTCKVLA